MKMPPLLKRVKGAVCDYKVVLGGTDETNAGECVLTPTHGEIRISPVYPLEYQWQTFFHEWIHKLEEEGGFKLKDDPGDSDVNRLATAIFADYRRNRWTLPGA